MKPTTREAIEQLVDEAWDLHDTAKTREEAERFKLDVLNLLSKLPENEERLRIMQ
jgi:hypothetical protein